MNQENEDQAAARRFFYELEVKFREAGFSAGPVKNGKLPVSWQNVKLCKIDHKGDVFSKPNMEEYGTQLDQVVKTSRTVSEYMRLIESAPPLQAKSLTMDYRLLSEHNGVVLAAHPSWFGAEFATWEWVYGHTAL